jgi:hypothetical protein
LHQDIPSGKVSMYHPLLLQISHTLPKTNSLHRISDFHLSTSTGMLSRVM